MGVMRDIERARQRARHDGERAEISKSRSEKRRYAKKIKGENIRRDMQREVGGATFRWAGRSLAR